MEKDELDSDVVTGSSLPSESPVLSGEEAMDQTPGPSGEQETKEMPETAEEEPVLPRLRVRFQDDVFKSGNNRRLITCSHIEFVIFSF